MLEQSAVCLPELHLQVHKEGHEERKSEVDKVTRLPRSRRNIAVILMIRFHQKVVTWKVGLPKERDGIADLSVTCEGWSPQSPFHKAPVSPTSTITPNEIYLFLSCALNIQQQ